MMLILTLLLFSWLQVAATQVPPAALPPAPPITVVVGLLDEQKLVVENPQFTGFIESREDGTFLLYRQEKFQGEISLRSLARIDFGEYDRNRPFAMTLTLQNGAKVSVHADRRDYLMVKGQTEFGMVTVKHPDPLSSEVRLSTNKPDREDDLTIQYLEFPAS